MISPNLARLISGRDSVKKAGRIVLRIETNIKKLMESEGKIVVTVVWEEIGGNETGLCVRR